MIAAVNNWLYQHYLSTATKKQEDENKKKLAKLHEESKSNINFKKIKILKQLIKLMLLNVGWNLWGQSLTILATSKLFSICIQ